MAERKLPDGLTSESLPGAPVPPPETLNARSTGPAAPPHQPTPTGDPDRIGRFQVRKLLGEGAFARVYLGFDPELEREVAIKVPNVAEMTPAFRDAFLRENRLAAIVHHANICPIYEVGTDAGRPYIVMRVVPDTLAGLLKRLAAPMPARTAAAIARKLALGLAAAHVQKIIHRDLKPANVLYDETNREVLLADFGLARFVDQATAASNGVPKGTPAYMAPEQARGQAAAIGAHSDVYSLGVILYEMLTGRIPFDGSVWEVMRDHCETVPPPPSRARPGLDPRLDAVCLKALAKNPADRYPSAKDFASALGDYLRGGELVEEVEALPIAETLSGRVRVRPAAPVEVLELPDEPPPPPPAVPVKRPSLPRAMPVPEHRRSGPPPLPPAARASQKPPPVPPPLPRRPPELARGTPLATKLFLVGFGVFLLCGAALGVGLSLGLWSGTKSEPSRPSKPADSGEKAKTPADAGTKEAEPPVDPPKGAPAPKTDVPLKPGFTGGKPIGGKPAAPTAAELRERAEADYLRGQACANAKPPDFAKVREWYEKAAEQGHANAQVSLGTLYHRGDGGVQNYTLAREWYEKAAAQGNGYAQTNLGILHEFGLGVPKDTDIAVEWYRKGSANGNTTAKAALARLEKVK